MKPVSRIAVIAPSGAFQQERFAEGCRVATDWGLQLDVFDGIDAPDRYLAAPDDVRLAHLVTALTDPRFDAVWAVRGGYGVTRLLDRIPFHQLRPIPLIGFSDLTPLLSALHARLGAIGLHAPVLHSLAQTDEPSRDRLRRLLAGEPPPPLRGRSWSGGSADGVLVGGNLAMIAATVGTPFQIDPTDAVLLLEDVGESPYRIDRMLQQLRSAGLLDRVAGIALGTFEGCQPRTADWGLDSVLREHLEPLGVPVLAELPIGHGPANAAVPIGARVRIDHDTLSWPEAAPLAC